MRRTLDDAFTAIEQSPADTAARDSVAGAAVDLARHVLALRKHDSGSPVVEYALQVIRRMSALSLFPEPARRGDLAMVGGGQAKHWPELIAMMLLGAPGDWSEVPRFATVPHWLWKPFAEWLFASPWALDPAAEMRTALDRYTAHVEELANWVERNLGSAAVRSAAETYVERASMWPFAASPAGDLCRLANARARILGRLVTGAPDRFDPVTWDRGGRKLRVGVLCRCVAGAEETYGMLGRVEHLDRTRFELTFFALEVPECPVAAHLRRRAGLLPLTGDLQAQVSALRDASLDVLLLAGSVAGPIDAFTKLALHRCAPLQVLVDSSAVPAGLSTIDLRLGGEEALVERSGGRAAVAHPQVYDFSVPPAAEVPVFDRTSLGLPASATVLVTILRPEEGTAACAQTLARVAAHVPTARLLVYLAPGCTGDNRFLGFERRLRTELQCRGVDTDWAALFAAGDRTFAEAKALVELADVYLDPPGSVGSGWVAVAAWEAKPIVAGRRAPDLRSSGAAFARSAGLPGVADTPDAFVARAVELATNADARATAAAAAREAVARGDACFDSLGGSDELGFILEAAFDVLHANGRDALRAPAGPLAVTVPVDSTRAAAVDDLLRAGDVANAAELAQASLRSAPRDAAARVLCGRVLNAQGQHRRAVEYLLAAVQQRGDDAPAWFELAGALQGQGRISDAMKALESGLRLESGSVAGWVRMIDLAERGGATEIMREARSALKAIAPDHPRAADAADDEVLAALANLSASVPSA